MEKLLVHSYKGGTGKTTVALNAASLLSAGKRVLLIENDFLMPVFYAIFKRDPTCYFNDYLAGTASFEDVIVSDVAPNVDAVFTNKIFDPSSKVLSSDQSWFLSSLERLMADLASLEGTYDLVIFDTPPGWHLIVVNLIVLSTKALLILRPNYYAVDGTKRMIDILYKRAKPMSSWNIYLLFNQVPNADMAENLEKWTGEFEAEGIKFAGSISCSCETSYQMANEAMIFPPDHQFSSELQDALKKVF